MARYVDPVALLVPGAHRLGRVRVCLGAGDVLVRMGLGYRLAQVLLRQIRDSPIRLVLVCEIDVVALANDRTKEFPVVMQGGVDVYGYPGHEMGTLGRCPSSSGPTQALAAASRPGARPRKPATITGAPRTRAGARSTGRHTCTRSRSEAGASTTSTSAKATCRPSSSSMASAAAGRTGSRTSPAWLRIAAWWRSTCPDSANPRCRARRSRSRA